VLAAKIGIGGDRRKSINRSDSIYHSSRTIGASRADLEPLFPAAVEETLKRLSSLATERTPYPRIQSEMSEISRFAIRRFLRHGAFAHFDDVILFGARDSPEFRGKSSDADLTASVLPIIMPSRRPLRCLSQDQNDSTQQLVQREAHACISWCFWRGSAAR
jgi:hypothetical protein